MARIHFHLGEAMGRLIDKYGAPEVQPATEMIEKLNEVRMEQWNDEIFFSHFFFSFFRIFFSRFFIAFFSRVQEVELATGHTMKFKTKAPTLVLVEVDSPRNLTYALVLMLSLFILFGFS
jgi:hypothetical protein